MTQVVVEFFDIGAPAALGTEHVIDIHLDSRAAAILQPGPQIRTFTLGYEMWTEYTQLAAMPFRTFLHELGHSVQWQHCRVPRTPNFLLNYFLLKRKAWERQAEFWADEYIRGNRYWYTVPWSTHKLFKQ